MDQLLKRVLTTEQQEISDNIAKFIGYALLTSIVGLVAIKVCRVVLETTE